MLWRTMYLLVLVVVFTQLLALNPSLGVIQNEEPWVWVTVTALVVRETVIVSGGLWKLGRSQWLLIRFWWRLRFRVSRKVPGSKKRLKASRCDPEAERLAKELFPEQPADYFTWPELLALAALKVGIKGLFELMPEKTCVDIFLKVRWAQGLRCMYCGLPPQLRLFQENNHPKIPGSGMGANRYLAQECAENTPNQVILSRLGSLRAPWAAYRHIVLRQLFFWNSLTNLDKVAVFAAALAHLPAP